MLKKIVLSPFFTPVIFVASWLLFVGSIYVCFFDDILKITGNGGEIEVLTHLGYIVLLAVLLLYANDFFDKMRSWGIYLFLTMCCFLREMGIQHHLSQTDTTPFKSRFFLNPNNPVTEKIVFGAMLLLILATVLYLAFKYGAWLVSSFLKFNTISWSVAVLCTTGVVAKIVDRFPSNWRKAHDGVSLPQDVYAFLQLVEESSEMFLPYLAAWVLWQYHWLHKKA